jgi:hypothetical protein
MKKDMQAFALNTALDEIKKSCPDVSNTFIFTVGGNLLAKDDATDEKTAACAAKAITAVAKRADTLGGFETAAFYSDKNRVNVFREKDYYLTIVGSEESGGLNSASLARIVIPTALRLTEKIFSYAKEEPFRIEKPKAEEETPSHVEEISQDVDEEGITTIESELQEEQSEPEDELKQYLPDPPVTQFMVENIGGLLAGSDTVRIDSSVMQQWKDLFGERKIEEVDVETLNGHTLRCKFKPIKDSKHEGKGIIQLPQKIQRQLQTSKGDLVMVKPAITWRRQEHG